jgi:L-ascorbate metabolism protein UlaG (beta-lactamase superfamily)
MKLTKYEHACFTLERDGQVLVFDPGNWSTDFVIPNNVTAIMLTHEHADHFDIPLLRRIIDKNPSALILAPDEMAEQLTGFPSQGVTAGSSTTIGPFTLQFFGGEHAIIHPTLGSVVNVGVLVNNTFYYPGDSFVLPSIPIKTLALPVAAPWLKISESIDFMLAVKPDLAFPVHDHIASDDGKALVDRILGGFAETNGITYRRIRSSVDIA